MRHKGFFVLCCKHEEPFSEKNLGSQKHKEPRKHPDNTKNPNLRVPCDDSAALDAEDGGGGGGGGEALCTDSEEEEGKGAKHTNRSQDMLLVPIVLRSNSSPNWFHVDVIVCSISTSNYIVLRSPSGTKVGSNLAAGLLSGVCTCSTSKVSRSRKKRPIVIYSFLRHPRRCTLNCFNTKRRESKIENPVQECVV